MIRSLVDDAWRDAHTGQFAVGILRSAGVQQYDEMSQARAIYNWALSNFYFVNDPVTKEALRPVSDMLLPQNRYGDCDDINATLLPALLGSIGIETRLVTIAANPEDPNAFTHIYAEALIGGQWVPIDAARPGTSFGSAPPNFYRRKWWSLTDDSSGEYDEDSPAQMSGMGRYRGLAGTTQDIASILNTASFDASQIVRAVDGTPVLNALGQPIGPGGYVIQTPSVAPSNGNTTLLVLLGVGLLFWMASK